MSDGFDRVNRRVSRRAVLGVLGAALVADLATTGAGFAAGLSEANPAGRALLDAHGWLALPLAKGAALAALAATLAVTHRRYGATEQAAARAGCLIVAAIWTLAALWNAALIVALTSGLT